MFACHLGELFALLLGMERKEEKSLRRYAHHFKPTYCFCPTDLLVLQESHGKSVTFELRKHIFHISKQFPTTKSNGNFWVLPLERLILIVLP